MSAAVGRMNLAELIAAFPSMFYAQTWHVGESFMRILPSEPPVVGPVRIVKRGVVPKPHDVLPRAVDLAHLYVETPKDPMWQDYLWTADHDSQGQRVYVGGCANGKGFELHRHLHITERFQVPHVA